MHLGTVRADTPSCTELIHLNNAGASIPPTIVLQTIQDYLSLEAQVGGYEAADQNAEAIAAFYTVLAKFINAQPRNIAYANSATDAYNKALSAIPFRAGDLILTTDNDYSSNQIAFMALEKRFGVRVMRARDLPEGGVDPSDMETLIRAHHPALVAVTHVPTNSGLVQNIAAIGKVCREENVWYLVDACQSFGQIALDVEAIGCDFLSATMRKYMRGPRGVGFLYVSDRVLQAGLELMLPDMHGATWTAPDQYEPVPDARRFEYFEISPALLLGSKVAIEYAVRMNMALIEQRVGDLAGYVRHLIAELKGVQVLDQGDHLCGIVTVYHKKWDPAKIMAYLQENKVNCRISNLQAGQIDFARKNVPWALRISPHYYNNVQDIEDFIEICKKY
ncbi:MAG: aminotransferase class V-fold PLP-dependent enzyme [Saprospiraceae bacterium]|nr:aminotransferase class V-fold PLP-dependent enzyme [Saprospiraceae bacterium]